MRRARLHRVLTALTAVILSGGLLAANFQASPQSVALTALPAHVTENAPPEAEEPSAEGMPGQPDALPADQYISDGTPEGNRELGRLMALEWGWGDRQWRCLDVLWGSRESGWNHLVRNRRSGAHGIPQALPDSKMRSAMLAEEVDAGHSHLTSARVQIRWGLGYIEGRSGSPCAALNHSYRRGWY